MQIEIVPPSHHPAIRTGKELLCHYSSPLSDQARPNEALKSSCRRNFCYIGDWMAHGQLTFQLYLNNFTAAPPISILKIIPPLASRLVFTLVLISYVPTFQHLLCQHPTHLSGSWRGWVFPFFTVGPNWRSYESIVRLKPQLDNLAASWCSWVFPPFTAGLKGEVRRFFFICSKFLSAQN